MADRPTSTPDCVRSISKEWLSEALRSGGFGAGSAVSSFQAEYIGRENGWIGEVARLDIAYVVANGGAPRSMVVKFSPPDPDGVFGGHEAGFYLEIASAHNFAVPDCYYVEVDPRSGASVLLLEDLSRLRTVSFLDGCTVRQAEAAVMGLAKIHAAWWESEALQRKDWPFSIADTQFSDWWGEYPARIEAIVPEMTVSRRLKEFGDLFATDTSRVLQRIEGSPVTCIHRDIHVDNLLFGSDPGDPPVILVDWQTTGRGLGISDVAYLLISSLSPSDRRASERGLVARYHGYLTDHGVDDYDLDRCWSDYKISVASKLFISVTATVRLDNATPHRRAWRAADLERVMAFIDDHDPIKEL